MEKDPEEIMKKFFANFFFLLCIVIALLILGGTISPAFSQVGPGGGGNPCPGGEPCDPEVPIAGIEWLLVIGGLFGFRRIFKRATKH
jgi:hypothetical protein